MWEAGPAQQVREDSEGTDGHSCSLSVKNSLSSRDCGGPRVRETPHCQDPWLRADMEAVWGALGKGGPALVFFLPGTLKECWGGGNFEYGSRRASWQLSTCQTVGFGPVLISSVLDLT